MGCECATTTLNIVKAIVTRCLFVLLCVVTTWRLVEVKGRNSYYYLLLLTLIPLLIEATFTLLKRKGAEFKWFSPSFFCFLVCTVPGIWLLELDKRNNPKTNQANSTNANLTIINGLTIQDPFADEANKWIEVLEQVLMLLLVFSRWILPKGEITRERLSQILLVYIALASDIIELFDLYEMEEVMKDTVLFHIILVTWTLSLVQFTLVLAGSKSRKSQAVMVAPMNTDAEQNIDEDYKVDRVEVLSLMLTLALQDVPFLFIRIYIIAYYRKMSNTLLFFAAKNALIIALQFYRVSIIVCGSPEKDVDNEGVIDEPSDPEQGHVGKCD